jgi:hypothetical protein
MLKFRKFVENKFKIPKTLFIRPFVLVDLIKIYELVNWSKTAKNIFIIIISSSFRSLFDQTEIFIFCQFLLVFRKNNNFRPVLKIEQTFTKKWSKIRETDLNSNFFKIFRKN